MLSASDSHDVRYEPLSLLHVDPVRLAECFEQRAFFDDDAIAIPGNSCDRDEPEAEPAAEREPHADEHHHRGGIRWMPHDAVWTCPNHRLVRPRLDIAREILAQGAPAIAAEQGAEEHQQNSCKEHGNPCPGRDRPRPDECEREGYERRDPCAGEKEAD